MLEEFDRSIRIKKVKAMKELCDNNDDMKLAYYPSGNLVLLQKKNLRWIVIEETKEWWKLNDSGYTQ